MNRFFAIYGIALLTLGCSGSDGSGLLGDSGQPQDDATATDSAAQPDAGAPTDATTLPESSVADVSVKDVTPNLYVGPPDSKIQCGPSLTCSAQSQACCWHSATTLKPFECVTDLSSCTGTYDVPITCSSQANCVSEGNPSYTCCATGGNFGSGSCAGADIATVVTCKSSCTDIDDYPVGCSVSLQNCADTSQICIASKCTDPGATICN